MNIQDYISTGILEAYAIGELTEAERLEVEKNLALYPELTAELRTVEDTQEKLLTLAAIKPSSHVKSDILSSIKRPSGKVRGLEFNRQITFWKYAAAASIAIALLTTYMAYDYRSRWKESASDLNTLIAQNQKIAQDYNQVNQRIDRMESDMKVMDNPDFKRVVMRGTDNAPQSMAYVYWNESSQELYLSIQSMRKLSQENQYQLWAIIEGKPVDAGVFDGDVAGLLKMKPMAKGATTFAVTIEPRGGKSSPTLNTMQVAGNVDKS